MLMPQLPTQAHRPALSRILDREDLSAILAIYKPEHRYVAEATLHGRELTCSLRQGTYPYTTHQIFDYITAPTLTLLACQMTYVMVAGLVLLADPITEAIGGWDRFLQLRNDAHLRIGTMDVRFAEEVKAAKFLPATIKVQRSHTLRSVSHCRFEFSIGNGITGTIHGLIMK